MKPQMKKTLLFAAGITIIITVALSVALYGQRPQQAEQNVVLDSQHAGHTMTVTSDAAFLMGMIPHHQEAVDTSAYLLTRTSNPDLQAFLKGVIEVQVNEINQMKQWHIDWYSSEYQPDGMYMPMMGDLTQYNGTALEAAYIRGMIEHHKGAVSMAQQISALTSRAELLDLAQNIISTQRNEIALLETWLANEYSNLSQEEANIDGYMTNGNGHDMMHH